GAVAAGHSSAAPEDGFLVGTADHRRDRARHVHRLLDLGGFPERPLFRRSVSVAVLLALSVTDVPAQELRVRATGHPPADCGAALARVPHPRRTGLVPADLLLLPQGVLPLVLAHAARLRGARPQARVLR